MPRTLLCVAALYGVFLMQPAHAQDAQDVCGILASNMKQDVLEQGSDQQQLQQWQTVVKEDRYKNFSTASSDKINSGLSVVDVVYTGLGISGTLSGSHDASTWEKDRDSFLNIQSFYSTSSNSSRVSIRQASAAAYDAVVRCQQTLADRLGVFGIFKAPNHESFSVKIVHKDVGNNAFEITSFTANPRSAVTTCDQGVLVASAARPVRVPIGEFIISCEKVADRDATITINTSAGTVGPYTAEASTNEIRDLKEQIAQINNQVSVVSGQTRGVQDALNGVGTRISNLGHNRSSACYEIGRAPDGGNAGVAQSCKAGWILTGSHQWPSDAAITTWVQCCPLE